jgi:glutamine amidotransferase PdxT
MRCCSTVDARIGVLALQGNVSEHIDSFLLALERMGHGPSSEVFEVRSPTDLTDCNALGWRIDHDLAAHR